MVFIYRQLNWYSCYSFFFLYLWWEINFSLIVHYRKTVFAYSSVKEYEDAYSLVKEYEEAISPWLESRNTRIYSIGNHMQVTTELHKKLNLCLIKTLLVLLSLQVFGFLSIGFGFGYMQPCSLEYLFQYPPSITTWLSWDCVGIQVIFFVAMP
jgi:hypothetical protein